MLFIRKYGIMQSKAIFWTDAAVKEVCSMKYMIGIDGGGTKTKFLVGRLVEGINADGSEASGLEVIGEYTAGGDLSAVHAHGLRQGHFKTLHGLADGIDFIIFQLSHRHIAGDARILGQYPAQSVVENAGEKFIHR